MEETVWIERINVNNSDMKRHFENTIVNGVEVDEEFEKILKEAFGEQYREFMVVENGRKIVRFWGKGESYSSYPSPTYGNIVIIIPYRNGNYESSVYVGITSDMTKNDKLTGYLRRHSSTTWENADKFPNVFLVNVSKIDDKKLADEISNLFGEGQLIPPRGSLAKLSLGDFSEESQKTILEIINNLKSEISDNSTDEGVEMIQHRTLDLYYKSKGYHFPSHIISQFYVSLKTKGFVILSGLSGTGKTKIALEFAELLQNIQFKDKETHRKLSTNDATRMQNGYLLVEVPKKYLKNYIFLSVRPDWRDSKQLLGYYNPLDNKYYKTPLLELILKAIEDYKENKENASPYFVILDEMNLAHVEYYFADFLSVLESGRDEEGFTREGIKLHNVDEIETNQKIPKEIKLPPNLYIIGTVNIDETTYMFSPKVLDRAFTIEFYDVDLDNYPPKIQKISDMHSKIRDLIYNDLKRNGRFLLAPKDELNNAVMDFPNEYKEVLKTINKVLEVYDLHFGYRVFDEICLFFKNAKESWERGIVAFENEDEIFDLAMLMKILPKFHGNRRNSKNL
jgi:energy-coupling factor transporter ATP-binding protein EcfA2